MNIGKKVWVFPDGDLPFLGDKEPFGQYALVLKSSEPVVAQISRMDVRQPNLAYYTVMGHGE